MKITSIKLATATAILVASTLATTEQSHGQSCPGCFGYPTANAPAIRTTVFPFQQHVQPQTITPAYPQSGTWTTVAPQQFTTPTPVVVGQPVVITTPQNYFPSQPIPNTFTPSPSNSIVIPGTIVGSVQNPFSTPQYPNLSSSVQVNDNLVPASQGVISQVESEVVPGQIPSSVQPLQTAETGNTSESLQLSSPSDTPTETPAVANDISASEKAAADKALAELEAANAKLAEAKQQIRAMRERALASERASKLLKEKVVAIQSMSEAKIESMTADFANVKNNLKARETEKVKLAEMAKALADEKSAGSKLAAKAKSAAEMARKASRTQRELQKKLANYEQEFAAIKKAQANRKAEQAKMKAEVEKKRRDQDSKAKDNATKKKNMKAKTPEKTKQNAKSKKDQRKSAAMETEKSDTNKANLKSEDVRVKKLQESLERQVKKAKQIHQRELSKKLRQLHEDGGDDVLKKVEATKKKANKALEERIESIKKRVKTRIDRLGDK